MEAKPLALVDWSEVDMTPPTDRGSWRYNAGNLTLEYWRENRTGWSYYVDLERCTTCAQVLDWIAQLAGKADCFLADADLGAFVRLLNGRLHLQGHYCGSGVDRGTVDPKAVLKRVENHAAEMNKRQGADHDQA